MTPPILEMDFTVLMESIRNLKGNGSTRGKEARICSIEIKFWTLKQSYIEMTKDTSIKIAEISIQKELDIFLDDAIIYCSYTRRRESSTNIF